ncbi:MAG: NADH-quinone oxidoreductase subunit C [Candidatus Omnitrophica bacterium]|nr:NADH-quinone oxidoreductase subunit C [Candidatus Omnitrophota bacterium]
MDIASVIQRIEEQFPCAIAEKTPGWITLKKESLIPVFHCLMTGPEAFISLHCLTAVDRKDSVEVVYHLFSYHHKIMLTVKVLLPNVDLTIDSLTPLWDAANWLEREVFDLFGVKFSGHPDMRRILNPDHWTTHPLRKDFKQDGFVPRPVK